MCNKCGQEDKVHDEAKAAAKTAEVGQAVGETLMEGLSLLGRSLVWTSRAVANGSTAVGKGIAKEYKRQQQEGFGKE